MGRALVVGGTGPTGPSIVEGLLARGHDVTVFHTGRHEVTELPDVPHVHGSPFEADDITRAVGAGGWDVVVATYGRVRLIAEHVAHRCAHLVVVGGVPVYQGYVNPGSRFPYGVRLPVREDSHPLVAPDEPRFAGYSTGPIRRTEDQVFALGVNGSFAATYLRYPTVYGPRNPYAWEWHVVRRVLDGRPWMILADGGHGVHSRAAARNAAEAVLLAVDRPETAAGKAYNVADDDLLTVRQWVQLVARAAGRDLELRSLPRELPSPGLAMSAFGGQETPTSIVDTTRLRADLGYHDVVTVADGLAETVEWMLANETAMRATSTTDPFDYAAEDALVAAYDRALASLAPQAAPFGAGIGRMAVVQTAKGR
ncbi:NAD(P)H-binding protein [Amycolatopsis sp. FDAARGOS 1241]|uniref:NAD(P)H-binding protein n=1 Tax=Amycolatopsis sp. FDAARGOS 1241 TaxID=2778070 RepID=UPI0019514F45|nr:NAD(P)H-binding protein [Amycolatopsis sp. FDAARGOS 1241]QRP43105.1 NAD(P)H-binding protein [Amycolatopsis sp. FDAARGOS 1241]